MKKLFLDDVRTIEMVYDKTMESEFDIVSTYDEFVGYIEKNGSDWYSKRSSTVLKVPSAIIKQEFNFVLNTQHPDFSEITLEGIEDFNWDKRLL